MRIPSTRALSAIGLSVLFSLTVACGGPKTPPKAPESEPIGTASNGSSNPDQGSDSTTSPSGSTGATSDPPKTGAVSSTDNGSDIVPPFSGGAATATKDGPKKSKAAKKASVKPKKKPADKTAMNGT